MKGVNACAHGYLIYALKAFVGHSARLKGGSKKRGGIDLGGQACNF